MSQLMQCHLPFFLGPIHQLVVSVGKDSAHSVAVFHWQTRTTLFTAPSGPETVLGCHVVHEDLFVSCGVDHLRLWSRVGGSFELEQGEPVPVCCSLEWAFIKVSRQKLREIFTGLRFWHAPSRTRFKSLGGIPRWSRCQS